MGDSYLILERTFTNATSKTPYTKYIQEYSTNGYRSFHEGGTINNDKRVTSEASLQVKEMPVLGFPLFASSFYQARLLCLLKDPTVEDAQFEGENVCVIRGKSIILGSIPVNVKLLFSKSDYLLIEQELSSIEIPIETGRFLAKRGISQNDWPYSSICCEKMSGSTLVSRRVYPVSTKRVPAESSNKPDKFNIPAKTLITDERYGYPVVYRNSEKPILKDEDIAKMSTDPDYRTNSYYLKFNKIDTKSSTASNLFRGKIIILAIALISITPLIAIAWRWKRGIKCRRM